MSNIKAAVAAVMNNNPIEFEKHFTPATRESIQNRMNVLQQKAAASFFNGTITNTGDNN